MGGTSLAEDKERLSRKKYQILVGSPGRMKHLIKNHTISLESVRLLVLDEADKLMEECFQHDINFMFQMLPQRKQVIVASATYTQDLRDFLSLYMRTPSHICPYSTNILIGVDQYTSVVPSHLNSVRQGVINFEALKKILTEVPYKQCLVFCNYQTRTCSTHRQLNEGGWPSEYLSGCQNQTDRIASLEKLQSFSCRVLVATDLAARGLDAANVDLVVNLDLPRDLSTYLHRIGRAGRYGSKGMAITILNTKQEAQFKAMFEQFGDQFEIKPFGSVEPKTAVAIATSEVEECTMASPKDEGCDALYELTYDKSLISLMTSLQNPIEPNVQKHEIIDYVQTHSTFDSLLDSLNDFDSLCNFNTISRITGPESNLLDYVNSTVENIKHIEKSWTMDTNDFINVIKSPKKVISQPTSDKNECDNKPMNYKNVQINTQEVEFKSAIISYEAKVALNTPAISTSYSEKNTNSNFKDSKRKVKPISKKYHDVDVVNASITNQELFQNSSTGKPQSHKPTHSRGIYSNLNNSRNSHPANPHSLTPSNFMGVEKYLQWKSQLSYVSTCIQQSVYISTMAELSNRT